MNAWSGMVPPPLTRRRSQLRNPFVQSGSLDGASCVAVGQNSALGTSVGLFRIKKDAIAELWVLGDPAGLDALLRKTAIAKGMNSGSSEIGPF